MLSTVLLKVIDAMPSQLPAQPSRNLSRILVVEKQTFFVVARPRSGICRHLRSSAQGHVPVHADHIADIIVVGAGIVGLSTAATILQHSKSVSVAVVDQAAPCAGATGAGQGYIWMAHRDPGSFAWQLAAKSRELWQKLIPRCDHSSSAFSSFGDAVQWQANGSLLLAQDREDVPGLKARATALRAEGIPAQMLPLNELLKVEPNVAIHADGAALYVAEDAQLDGRSAAAALQQECLAGGDRCKLILNDGVQVINTDERGSKGLQASGVTLRSGKRVCGGRIVLCAGAWSGQLLDAILPPPSPASGAMAYRDIITPLRGHLLQIPASEGVPQLRHGVMECKYTKHYSQEARNEEQGIVFTATSTANLDLLLGSSRESIPDFDNSPKAAIVHAILQRAASFLPALNLKEAAAAAIVRVGLRPDSKTSLPLVGAVPGISNLYLNAGHSGSGLLLSPVTSHIISSLVLEASDEDIDGRVLSDLARPLQPARAFESDSRTRAI